MSGELSKRLDSDVKVISECCSHETVIHDGRDVGAINSWWRERGGGQEGTREKMDEGVRECARAGQ